MALKHTAFIVIGITTFICFTTGRCGYFLFPLKGFNKYILSKNKVN